MIVVLGCIVITGHWENSLFIKFTVIFRKFSEFGFYDEIHPKL